MATEVKTRLRVSLFSYPASFQNVGGGEILLLKMKQYLEKTGVDVRLFDMWNDKIEDFDLLHVFGSVKDCLGLIQVAKQRGVKVAISPIFWSSFDRAFHTYGSLKEKALLALRHAVKLICPAFPSARRRMLLESDLIFPNSKMEKDQISRLFAVPKSKMRVVYNGVDRRFADADPGPFKSRFGLSDYVLTVGRLEPRKNQLNLIRAIKQLPGTQMVVIGNPVSGFEGYARVCREEGEGFARFLPAFDHEDPLLASAYAGCRLYVLPGWFETPGLAAMEAALAGAPLAVTEGGSTREYFGDTVVYFDPSGPHSIARAVQSASQNGRGLKVREHVLENFLWDRIAEETLKAYREFLPEGRS